MRLMIGHAIGVIALVLVLLLGGCQSYRSAIISTADAMNQRSINSCFVWGGFVGIGLGSATGWVRGITATGGAQVQDCPEILGGQML